MPGKVDSTFPSGIAAIEDPVMPGKVGSTFPLRRFAPDRGRIGGADRMMASRTGLESAAKVARDVLVDAAAGELPAIRQTEGGAPGQGDIEFPPDFRGVGG